MSDNSEVTKDVTTKERRRKNQQRNVEVKNPNSIRFTRNVLCNEKERKGNVLFNDALNIFYLRLYGVRHMVKDHSDSDRGNPLPPHGLLFPVSSNGSFIYIIPQTG